MTSIDPRLSSRHFVIALCLLFAVTLPAVTPRLYASDEIEYYVFLRSAWFDRDVSFDNEYRHFYEGGIARHPLFHETFLERTTPTGLRENFATVGCAILWVPFYLVADVVARSGIGGVAWPADGYSAPYIAAVSYGSAVYGFLSLLVGWRIARVVIGGGGRHRAVLSATLAVLVVWFGTPLLFYMYIAPPMSHACSAFAVSVFILLWLYVRRRWSIAGLAALGATAALVTMVREQDAFVAVGPAIDFGWTLAASCRGEPGRGKGRAPAGRHVRRLIAGAALAVVTFAVTFLPQALAYLTINGRLLPSRQVEQKMAWYAPHAWSVLASPAHGLFAWTPLAALALVGLVWLAWQDSGGRRAGPAKSPPLDQEGADVAGQPRETGSDRHRIALVLLAMAASQVYIAGSVQSWTVAGAFGQRRFVALTSLLVVGLAALAQRVSSARGRFALVVAGLLGAWWNIGLVVQFGAGLMDRQRLELGRNAYVTFVELPARLPSLAYRYFFDRTSYFRGTVRPPDAPRETPR